MAEDSLCRSAADLSVAHERLSGEIAGGQVTDPAELIKVAGALRRTLISLGLALKLPSGTAKRDVKPTPQSDLDAAAREAGLL
jgi:hypothetical protein